MITKHSLHLVINNSLNFLALSLDLLFILRIFIILQTLSATELKIGVFLYTRFSLVESSCINTTSSLKESLLINSFALLVAAKSSSMLFKYSLKTSK
uniref:Uncharacterized protein n=1 Tax=Lepeophtheirus salmonis TaxID=72036 RepID=A0A0K2U3U9_LEPSM